MAFAGLSALSDIFKRANLLVFFGHIPFLCAHGFCLFFFAHARPSAGLCCDFYLLCCRFAFVQPAVAVDVFTAHGKAGASPTGFGAIC